MGDKMGIISLFLDGDLIIYNGPPLHTSMQVCVCVAYIRIFMLQYGVAVLV